MSKDWMPPLPDESPYSAEEMRDYALAAVEAYKKSLKPVAWMLITSRSKMVGFADYWEQSPGNIPLYRLDGVEDDAA